MRGRWRKLFRRDDAASPGLHIDIIFSGHLTLGKKIWPENSKSWLIGCHGLFGFWGRAQRPKRAMKNLKWSKMVNFSSFSVPHENFTSFHPWFLDFVHVFRPFWTLQGVKLHFFAPKMGVKHILFKPGP